MTEQRIIFLCARLHEQANAFLAREIRRLGLSGIQPCHGDVLRILYEEDGARCSDIAARMHRTKATVTALVDKLEKLGYAERRPDSADGRAQRVWLTARGRAARGAFETISAGLAAKVEEPLAPGELALLDGLLARLVEGWEQSAPEETIATSSQPLKGENHG